MSDPTDTSWAWEGRQRPAPTAPPATTDDVAPGTDLRPLNNGQILDTSFRLLREHLRVLVGVTAAFSVPVNLLASFLSRDFIADVGFLGVVDDPQATAETTSDLGLSELASGGVSLIAAAVILPLVAGAVSRIVAAAHVGRSEDLRTALRVVRRRAGALVGGWLLVHLLEGLALGGLAGLLLLAALAGFRGDAAVVTFVGFLLIGVVLAVIVMARLMLVSPAIVEEGLGGFAAVRRSSRLVRGRTFSVLRLALITGFIAQVLDNILAVPGNLLGAVVGVDSWGWILVAAGSVMAQLVTVPFVAIVATLAYFDSRVRREGLDLELMAAELLATEPQQAG